ncbi:Pre-mRNA-processing protein 40C [Spatholobus suberectus]|nr:Pre-mRNA-processing protein 40C [Spatholobus suberectus]
MKDPLASWTESKPILETDPLGHATNPDLNPPDSERLFWEHIKMQIQEVMLVDMTLEYGEGFKNSMSNVCYFKINDHCDLASIVLTNLEFLLAEILTTEIAYQEIDDGKSAFFMVYRPQGLEKYERDKSLISVDKLKPHLFSN